MRRSRGHAALGIRQDTEIAARCKLRACPAGHAARLPAARDARDRLPQPDVRGGAAPALASLLIDHYGLMGLAQRLATPGRIAGVALIFAGMIVVQWQTPAPCVPAATGDAAAAQPEPQR
ncbi:DMT family transporter [Burkholderia contaminans]|uniref:DMT family transporter n=1 Tax=Burkholderia contaminans TaxID=488447 RepID=UPI00210EEE0F|nr:DMT family transporter [Burkholderia contaminans]